MMVALVIPPHSHIVGSAYRPPRCSSALTSVVMIRAPLAPNGCPMAIAPPFTFALARSAPVSLAQASVGLTLCGYEGSRPQSRGRQPMLTSAVFCDKQDCRRASEGVAHDLEA